MAAFYGEDLSFIHHEAYGGHATNAAPELLRLLEREGVPHGRIVDLGCGSGIWARELVKAGYAVLGVDVSGDMIEIARKTAPAATFIETSLHQLDLPPSVAVTALGESLSYIGEEDPRDTLPSLFQRVYRALLPGGLLIFDVIVRSRRQPMRYNASTSGEGWQLEVDVTEDPRNSILTRQIH